MGKPRVSPTPAEWEVVCTEPGRHVRRIKVENGWLYQVQTDVKCTDHHMQIYAIVYKETTFVPERIP